MRTPFTKPQVVACDSAAQEAEYVAQRILELRDEGTKLSEIAVLFRAAHHSQAVEFELLKRGVPYDYRGGMKFFERAHVKDALAYLRTVVNKDDAVAWDRVLSLQVGVGSVTAARIFERVRVTASEDLGEALSEGLPARAVAGWRSFVGAWRRVRVASPAPSNMLREVLASDYLLYLENEYPDWKDRQEDLETLAEFAGKYEDVSAFLADVALDDRLTAGKQGLASSDDSEPKMVLSTVHQAKGLEWDAVFVIHLTQGQFPNQRALLEGEGLEEERRLLYVAVTRARRDLSLSYPRTLAYGGDDGFGGEAQSIFLEELSPRLYEKVGVEETWDDLPAIIVDSDGEMIRPRKGLLRDIDEY
jgi:DNA helicase-2/ATP-dependent DNA helicase PcrA